MHLTFIDCVCNLDVKTILYVYVICQLFYLFYYFSEKHQLLSVEDFGDTMAAVQGLLKKHDAFETDFAVHRDRCEQISHGGIDLADSKNHHADSILQRCQQLQVFL